MASDLERLFEQETVDIITDLVGKQHANSGTTCRVVEDHLKQLLRNIERLRKGDGEREPTEAMIEAGIQELPWGQQSPVTVSKCWSAMIAAAPTAKESGK